MAYIDSYKLSEHPRILRRRVYWTLRGMAEAGNPPRVMRIMHLHPSADWERIRTNSHEFWTMETVKINWYVVIHDILSTNERVHKIRLVDSPRCGHCGEPDTVQNRVTACVEGARIWLWTKRCIVWILRIDPAHTPPDWTTRPQFRLLPPQRHRAVLLIPAQIVWYRIKESLLSTEQDYSDFLRRIRWKAYQVKHRRTNFGNALEIL